MNRPESIHPSYHATHFPDLLPQNGFPHQTGRENIMRKSQTFVFIVLGTIFAVAMYLTLRSFGMLGDSVLSEVKPVPQGSLEIAWLGPATGAGTWERLVEAADQVKKQWSENPEDRPQLIVHHEDAFPGQTAEVPEISLWLEGKEEQKLLFRWYKTSSEMAIEDWVAKLAKRDPPPVAILGGENTTRAVETSFVLKRFRQKWNGPAPLFLITTATADAYTRRSNKLQDNMLTEPGSPKLMNIYKNRNFRFSFTNTLMTQGVMDFVQDHPELWSKPQYSFAEIANLLGSQNALEGLIRLKATESRREYAMYALSWADDEYTLDLRDRFLIEFKKRYDPDFPNIDSDFVVLGTGDQFNPNPQDVQAVWRYLLRQTYQENVRRLLVLPTSAVRARRFLRALLNSAPRQAGNLVVLSGDSISFNHIYRDRKLDWNILELPVPLVFFSHRNPIDKSAGFHPEGTPERPWATSGTQDLLLYRDVVESLLLAGYQEDGLVANADELNNRLLQLNWAKGKLNLKGKGIPLFDAQRNRQLGTGEHIVLLKPHHQGNLVLPTSTISVWYRETLEDGRQHWALADELEEVFYSDPMGIAEE